MKSWIEFLSEIKTSRHVNMPKSILAVTYVGTNQPYLGIGIESVCAAKVNHLENQDFIRKIKVEMFG